MTFHTLPADKRITLLCVAISALHSHGLRATPRDVFAYLYGYTGDPRFDRLADQYLRRFAEAA